MPFSLLRLFVKVGTPSNGEICRIMLQRADCRGQEVASGGHVTWSLSHQKNSDKRGLLEKFRNTTVNLVVLVVHV